ncbi:ubinuclein-1-like [Iris pallida]|uniref:Ubinuclein-1-like n=1 Tax=Iris pallida TaxID=29817 RepID=A0AAX6FB76_IRIPA|nr:ubinuclein-1-like [Iris pallida]KAJ6837436.1 ubinuclein-1-like [Iris pallida]
MALSHPHRGLTIPRTAAGERKKLRSQPKLSSFSKQMEEETEAMVTNSRVSLSVSPSRTLPLPLPPAKEQPPAAESGRREMFSVELKPGETTIVSWRKLLKEASKAAGKPPADPAIHSEAVPASADSVQPMEGDLQDAPPANRFSAVIEKIERLYMGEQSSDEEKLDDIPDDDQYDTEDSFIDDAELDEYFQVDKLSTKHNGYFVNRGKLEKIESYISPNLTPRKRRRKDPSKVHSENKHEHVMHEPVNTGNVRIKAAARTASLTGKKSWSSSANVQTNSSEHYQEGKVLKNKVNTSTGTYKKQSAEFTNLENPSSLRVGKDVALLALETKDLAKHTASRDRSISSQVASQSRKSLNGENEARVSTKVRHKERYGTGALPDVNSAGRASCPMQAVQRSSTRVKEGSIVRPKGTTLERAIRDFEKIVVLCRPPRLDLQEDTTQGVKRRLPQEVKQKLAKVARLSASQNKITEDDIIDRLMGIVGHLVQRKTLKRNMREMVEVGLSAKQQKADRYQQIKQELNEMIRRRITLLKSKVAEQHDGSADDFQEVKDKEENKVVSKYDMDTVLEDKICDLYDLYVEGMDEDKGPLSRKLYVELAELWPNGSMDKYGIKDAIFRSKDRKRARVYRHKARDEERIKRKKMAMMIKVEDSSPTAQVQSGQERPMDSTSQVLVPSDKVTSVQSIPSSGRMAEPAVHLSDVGYHHGPKHHAKARLSTGMNMVMDNGSKAVVAEEKKIKIKPESDIGEIHGHPTQHGKEKHGLHRDEMNASHQPEQKPQLPVALGTSDLLLS